MATALIADPGFRDHETGAHPETPLRLDAIQRALEGDEELWSRLTFPECRPASEDAIRRCHSRELIDDIRWWTRQDLLLTPERVFPPGLGERLGDILAGRFPPEPVEIP